MRCSNNYDASMQIVFCDARQINFLSIYLPGHYPAQFCDKISVADSRANVEEDLSSKRTLHQRAFLKMSLLQLGLLCEAT